MRNHRFVGTAAGVIATAALAAGVATAGTSVTTIPFTAKYAGTAVVRVTEDVADITANGPGKGTLLGVGKVTGKGLGRRERAQPCVPFTGTGTLDRHRQDQARLQGRHALEGLRRRGWPGLQHQRTGHRDQGLREARERPRASSRSPASTTGARARSRSSSPGR